MKRFRLTILFIFLTACNLSQHKEVDPYDFQNEVTDSSVLYFKNMRQIFYDKTIHEASKMEQFRLGKRVETTDRPIINLCIVLNILTDRGYIMIEPNEYLQSADTLQVQWNDLETQTAGEYQFAKSSMPKHFQFASELYASLQKNHEMSIVVNGKSFPILQEEDEREAFRITMYDYFRMVGAI